MLTPISEISAKFFESLDIDETDRLHISLNENENFVCEIHAAPTKLGGVGWPSFAAINKFPERIPERKRLDSDKPATFAWEFAATDITASLIHYLWPQEQVSFDDDAKLTFDYLLLSAHQLNRNAEVIAAYKANKTVPQHDLQFCADLPLAPHQQTALYLMYHNEGFASFMQQGTGKTAPTIAMVDNRALNYSPDRMLRVLIVSPKNVCMNWRKEFADFSTVEGKVTVLRGTEMQRIKLMHEAFIPNKKIGTQYTAIICGYDILSKFAPLTAIDWDIVILDESHSIKDSGTKRWKACKKLRERSRSRFVLTGSPYGNSIVDIYTQLEFLGEGRSGFKSLKNFKDFYCVYENGKMVDVQNMPFIKERLAQSAFFVTKKEALPDLPDKNYQVIGVDMTAEQEKAYYKLLRELTYEYGEDLDNLANVDSMTVNNILTRLLRLAQITSGFVTWDEVLDDDGRVIKPKRVERFKKQPKFDAICEILKERDPTEKTIIWACWTSDIIALHERLQAEGFKGVLYHGKTSDKQREENEYAFNHDDSCTYLIGNAAAGGTGLNLIGYPPKQPELSECDVTQEMFLSQNWSSLQREQAEDRGHRRGTRRPVTVFDFMVPDTIDEEIRARVTDKRTSAYELSDLKSILINVLKGGLR